MIAWVIVYFCVFRGVKSSSYVVWVTVPLPIILVIILVIRGSTLDGASDGIDLYLNGEDTVNSNKALEDDKMWSDATGQIFFTLSICMGVMTSYGSYNKPTKPVILDSFVIALVNSSVSFISGFAVFSTIGYLRHINSPVSSQMTSFGLAFIAYPTAASTMSGANFWNLLLFTTLFLLGIDSAFSMVEAIATVIYDTPLGRRMNRMVIAAILCIFCGLWSLAFCADVGLVLLDVVDYYTNTYMLQILGVLQPFAVGWVYEQDVMAERVGWASLLTYNVGFWVSTELPIIIAIFGIDKKVWIGVIIMFALYILVFIVSWKLSKLTFKEFIKLLPFSGVRKIARHMTLLTDLEQDEQQRSKWAYVFEFWWCFSIKYFLPVCISILLFLSLHTDIDENYGDYPTGTQWIGRTLVIIFVILIVAPIFFCTTAEDFELEVDRPYEEMRGADILKVAKDREERERAAEKPQEGAGEDPGNV